MASASEQPTSSAPSWWQRVSRWLRRVLLFVWGTLGVNILVGTIANLNTTTTDTPLSKLYIIHVLVTYPFPTIVSIATLCLLTALSLIGSRERRAASYLSPDQQSRVGALKALRKAYTDELAASLQGMARISLRLHERTGLTHPARLVSWQSGQKDKDLPAGTTIIDAYDQAGNGLLILGEPGVGKSTMLYDLAQVLLSRTEQNEQYRLPVILNLSSWATKQLPLETWLVEELQLRYLIPRQLSQRWEQQAKLLLLLDGLNEVADSARGACIKAINTYLSGHFMSLVVCSRRGEYEALSEQLTLQSAVIVQPLSSEQVTDYLAVGGEGLATVQTVIKTNSVLRELLTTPLMLSVVVLAYRDRAVEDLPQLGTAKQQQQQIFADYVERVLEQRSKRGNFTPQHTRHWLTWLAQRMQQYSLTEFYLERLQPIWFVTKHTQANYRLFYGLLVGLMFGLIFGLAFGLCTWLTAGISLGLLGGLIAGLGFGLLGGLIAGLGKESLKEIRYTEVLVWSKKGIRRGLLYGLLLGLVTGLVFGLAAGLSFGLAAGLYTWLSLGPFVAMGFVLLFVTVYGRSGEQISENKRAKPNQGIRSSGWNALRTWLEGLYIGMFLAILYSQSGWHILVHTGDRSFLPIPGLGLLLLLGPILALGFAVTYGGNAYIKHYILRFIFIRSGAMPWHYVGFLEAATECILLQRVGGGYRFIHPLFLDYFASGAALAPPIVESRPTQQSNIASSANRASER